MNSKLCYHVVTLINMGGWKMPMNNFNYYNTNVQNFLFPLYALSLFVYL
jgi:hypothetical protein